MRIWKQVDGWSIASLENSERIDDWSVEAGYCVMEQKAMMDGAWVREAKTLATS